LRIRQYEAVKEYQALIWRQDWDTIPRVTVSAENLEQARDKLRAEYGQDTSCSLWNEEDAEEQLDEFSPRFKATKAERALRLVGQEE
jgi:hypothetical protein